MDPTVWLADFVAKHPRAAAIIVAVIAVYTVLRLIFGVWQNSYLKDGITPPRWLRVVNDVLAGLPQPGKVGVFGPVNLPGFPSFGGGTKQPPSSSEKGAARLVVMIGVAGLGLVVVLASGCASKMTDYYRSTATGAIVSSTGFQGLSQISAVKEAGIRDLHDAGDKAGALLAREQWRPRYSVTRKVLDALSVGVVLMMQEGPSIEALASAATRSAKIAAAIAGVTKLVADAIAECAKIGVSIPLPGGG